MYRLRFLLSVAATLFFSLAICSTTQAAPRTWVSGTGIDNPTCSRAEPCRSFQAAHDAVDANGQVAALDSAVYGAVNISKNVTISGEGVNATAGAFSGDAITINAPSVKVVLRSLSIEGFGTGGNGIHYSQGTSLAVENCTINGFTEDGILIDGAGRVSVKNTIVRNNAFHGLVVNPPGSGVSVQLVVDSSQFITNSLSGLRLIGDSSVTASVRNSVASGNTTEGFWSDGGGTAHCDTEATPNCATLVLEGSTSSNNTNSGVNGWRGGTVYVANSVISGNGTGIETNAGSGFVYSRVTGADDIFTNTVIGNVVAGAFTAGGFPAQ